MANEAFNDWSPFKRALFETVEPDDDPGGIGADAQQKADAVPARDSRQDRIPDDTSSGRRGVTPNSTVAAPSNSSGFYDMATAHPYGPQFPLERQIATDKTELDRLNAPTRMTLRDKIGSVLGRMATAGRGESALEHADTLQDRVAARKQQERESLANRIGANTRALTTAGISEEGQNLRARMAAQANETGLAKLGATLASREREGQANRESRESIAGDTLQFKEKAEADKLAMFQNTDQYRRWKAELDNNTKARIAALRVGATANKAPAALMQTAVFAKGGLDRMAAASQAMNDLERSGVMGNIPANKIEDYLFGKGLVDPSLDPATRQKIGQLRAALGYTSSAAMRAHTGRTSQEIYNDFKSRLGVGQDWNALRGAMQETQAMLTEYATAASDANIAAIRGGTNVSAPAPTAGGAAQPTHRWVNGKIVPVGTP